ncbi:MAG: hypothetical protein KatS3mg076_2528 [Candidatus Binatia bacterium]|nr:MAG: hypothetical protein KatS3mg076_2528 [Candidatus Binatia bacterium]
MGRMLRWLGLVFLFLLVFAGWAFFDFAQRGLGTRRPPSALETFVARRLRLLAIPAAARRLSNPVPLDEGVLREARAHFADHCALCHANDGSGQTAIGRALYPPAPDMRKEATQSLTDGELYYIIRNGIRFTGMPAWVEEEEEEDDDRETWKLVHFIRHLPDITEEEIAEMERLNPKSAREWEEEEAIRRFLEGERP